MIHLNRRNRSYSDNGGERADRHTDHDHPAFSHATFGLTATGVLAATAVGGLGLTAYQMSQGGAGGAPPPRNIGNEINTIAGAVPGLNQQGFNNAALYNGQMTQLNQNNFNNAMRGNFDPMRHEQSNPGFMKQFQDLQASGELQGWTPEQFAMANSGNNQAALAGSYGEGFGTQVRNAYNSANPDLVNYTQGLGATMAGLNANAPGPVNASGYNSAGYNASGYNATGSGNTSAGAAQQAQGFNAQGAQAGRTDYGQGVQGPAQLGGPQNVNDVNAQMVNANTGYDRVNGNLGFDRVNGNLGMQTVNGNMGYDRTQANTGFDRVRAQQGDIGLASATQRMLTGGPSDIQQSLEREARGDLALGGSLSGEQVRNSQQAAREAGAARGLINSNSTVAAEILNRDAASSARRNERRGFAAAVDQKGFGERQQGFANALGVSGAFQNYGAQDLSAQQSNLGAQMQGNELNLRSQLGNQDARGRANALNLQGQGMNQDAFGKMNALNLQGQMANQDARGRNNALNLQGQIANQDARGRSNALDLQGQIANQGTSLAAAQSNQGRDLRMNDQRFQVGQANQNAGLENNRLGLGYAGLNNSAFQDNANRFQQNNQYNANLGQQNSQFNAGAMNEQNRFNANLLQQNSQFNAGAINTAAGFNANASNDTNRFTADAANTAGRFNADASNNMNRFNASLQSQNNNDAWGRAMGYGNFMGQQAINPLAAYGMIQGQAPDYTNALLGYGQDVNSTNYNAQAAANIAAGNRNSAMMGAGLGLVGNAANAYGNYAGAGRYNGTPGSGGGNAGINGSNSAINPATGMPW